MPDERQTVTDADGRVLEMRAVSWRERMRMIRVCGAAADIDRFMGHALIAASVRAIDGTPMPFPTRVEDVESATNTLDDAGMEAAAKWLSAQQAPRQIDTAAAKKLARHPELIETLWLVKNGVPYEAAFELDAEERMAYLVIFAEFQGAKFDWRAMRWVPQR